MTVTPTNPSADFSAADRRYMARAIALAKQGEGRTAPNPPVGAVVVKGDRVVGRGWHKASGAPHAEPMALDQAGDLAKGATVYVTLEPCNHYGRTPPCTERLIAAGVSRVVIGVLDPNPGVAGGGAARLAEEGIEVASGLLAERCQALIAPFARHVMTGRPWVVLKLAQSLDGRIATRAGVSQWLTGAKAKAWAHRLRNGCEAIMVGRGTVQADDPALTTRLASGRGQNPLRVVLDSNLALSPGAQVVTGPREGGPAGGGCLIFCGPEADRARADRLGAAGAEVAVVDRTTAGLDLEAVLAELGRRNVMRLMVEGGPKLAGQMIRQGLIDEVCFLVAPLVIGGGDAPGSVAGPPAADLTGAARLEKMVVRRLGDDLLVSGPVAGRGGE